MKERKKLSLAAKTFIGFGVGIVIGLIFGEKATVLAPLGDIFLNMIQMIVVPMVFLSITAGVASLGDLRKLRNIGVKVVGLYATIIGEEERINDERECTIGDEFTAEKFLWVNLKVPFSKLFGGFENSVLLSV